MQADHARVVPERDPTDPQVGTGRREKFVEMDEPIHREPGPEQGDGGDEEGRQEDVEGPAAHGIGSRDVGIEQPLALDRQSQIGGISDFRKADRIRISEI